MPRLAGKIAWITGAGSGIGEAAALALADEGATIVLTGRTAEKLENVAARIRQQGGEAHVQPADLTDEKQVQAVGAYIRTTFDRLDILVNNAGVNIVDRHWDKLTPGGHRHPGAGQPVAGAVLRHRRAAVHARAAGRRDDPHRLDGRTFHRRRQRADLHRGEARRRRDEPLASTCRNASTASAPPCSCRARWRRRSSIKRPNPVGPEVRANMVQPEDCGDLIRYIACLPKHVVMNEVHLAPTHNRGYVAALQRQL